VRLERCSPADAAGSSRDEHDLAVKDPHHAPFTSLGSLAQPIACTLLGFWHTYCHVVRDKDGVREPTLLRVFDEADEVVNSEEATLDSRHVHLATRGEAYAITWHNVDGPLRRHPVAVRTASIAVMISGDSGSVTGRKRPTTRPAGETRNFSKFHWTSPLRPSASGAEVNSR
jgi:hypothetical protein